MLDNSCDPDKNVFDVDIQNIYPPYILPEEFESFSCKLYSKSLSVLHLNTRSLKKNFDSFKHFLSSLNFEFRIICFSEIWLDDSALACESLYKLPHYNSVHQLRGHGKGGGVSIYMNDSFNYKVRTDLSVNNNDIESPSIETLFEKKSNILINDLYRPPSGLIVSFENSLKDVFDKIKYSNKKLHIVGDVNLNLLDYEKCKNI